MSIETVKNRCLANVPDMNIDALEQDINKQMQRFERIVKTAFNESQSSTFWQFSNNPVKAKNESFERYKLEYIHQHLRILIDLYDYKKPE